ncbi:hypothetical protein GGX14DRAFT_632319 [Mycena pura]|uniref:Uncharacterized protein n=1 Tax=Mycena pura TaxID=153505 RepID=A0AAD6VD23_9AGAR|nr:hypothetical protein GGX14DRAFT_632319 [Mycena pura]
MRVHPTILFAPPSVHLPLEGGRMMGLAVSMSVEGDLHAVFLKLYNQSRVGHPQTQKTGYGAQITGREDRDMRCLGQEWESSTVIIEIVLPSREEIGGWGTTPGVDLFRLYFTQINLVRRRPGRNDEITRRDPRDWARYSDYTFRLAPALSLLMILSTYRSHPSLRRPPVAGLMLAPTASVAPDGGALLPGRSHAAAGEPPTLGCGTGE